MKRPLPYPARMLPFALLLAACSGGDEAPAFLPESTAAQSPSAMAPAAMQPAPEAMTGAEALAEPPAPEPVVPTGEYPSGPYGDSNPGVGDVVENLSLRGIMNFDPMTDSVGVAPTDADFQTLRDQGMTHVAIVTAATWCGSCRNVARELGGELKSRVQTAAGNGGLMMQVILDTSEDTDLTAWADFSGLSTLIVSGADGRASEVFSVREWSYVIELETMQVVFSENVGIYTNPSAAVVVMDQLEALLQ